MRKKQSHLFEKELKRIQWAALGVKLLHVPYAILIPVMISAVITQAMEGKTGEVMQIGFFLLCAVIGFGFLNTVLQTGLKKRALEARQNCKLKLYGIFFENPLEALYHSGLGENLENFSNDFHTVADRITEYRPAFLAALAEMAVFGIYLFWKSPIAAVIIIIIAFLQVIPPIVVKKFMQVNYDKCRDIESDITEFTVTAFRGFHTIKMYQLQGWWLGILDAFNRRYKKIGSESVYAAQAEGAMHSLLDNILKYGTYCIVGFLALIHIVSIDTGIQAVALSGSIYAAVKNGFSLFPQFAVADTAEGRMKVWFDGWKKMMSAPLVQPSGNTALLELENISFAHEKTLFKGVSVRMDAAKRNVIKGPNGTGKSTLFHLLSGMETPDEGKVSVLGNCSENLSGSSFPGKIFYLLQEDPKFDVTPCELYESVAGYLQENGGGFCKKEDAMRNAVRFGLSEQLLRNDKIAQLSGGERKKVFLAMAFWVNAPVLLLDEPTNHLDENGKKVLMELLDERVGGAVIITHDKIFDEMADCIWHLQGGALHYES